MPRPLLPPIAPEHIGRKCLVLDLDETLVHSNFRVSLILLIDCLGVNSSSGYTRSRLYRSRRN